MWLVIIIGCFILWTAIYCLVIAIDRLSDIIKPISDYYFKKQLNQLNERVKVEIVNK